MPDANEEKSGDSTLNLIAKKIRSQILLFSLAIALVIVILIQVSGADAVWPIAAILVVFLGGAAVYAFVEKGKVESVGEGAEMLEAVPDSKGDALAVSIWVKHADGSDASRGYRLGDQVRVCARATQDCYLTLLNLSSDGELTILFPNRFNQNNRIQAGVTCEVPSEGYGFNIRLEEPAGMDRVKAIVTLDPKPLLETQFGPDGEFFLSVKGTAAPRAMRVVAESVKELGDKRWAAASAEFEVKER